MSWSLKRQLFFIGIIVILFFIFGIYVIYPYINKLPTCSDGLQNGEETGVDCGGTCAEACSFEVDEVSVLWSRVFEVIPGRYNAVAYLENHNKTEAINKIKYKFRFADKDNIYIGKREGETFIPASGKFAIFEPGIGVGNSIPVYTTFEFIEAPVWAVVSEEKLEQLKVLVSNIKLEDEDSNPRLSATLKNDSLFNISEINVVALLYDEKGNAVSASRTYLDILNGEESIDINFTWPQPFTEKVISKEVIPMFNIFSAKLK